MLTPQRWVWPGSWLLRAVDTDTLDVQLTCDVGFGRSQTGPQRVRLARCDGYRLGTPLGDAGRLHVVTELSGRRFTVETLKPYKYGGSLPSAEYMAEVTVPDGRLLSDVLIALGLALPWDGRGPRPSEAP